MLSEICQEIRNWFDRDTPHFHGAFEIVDGKISDADVVDALKENQYFRISGSVFNDGVYKNTNDLNLTDEAFVGSVTLMAVPKAFVDLANEIKTWQANNGAQASSLYTSESFGGYSYTKATKSSGSGAGANLSWKDVFASRLNNYRKI